MKHLTQSNELLNKERLAKDINVKQDEHTNMWFAYCKIPYVREVIRWGTSEASAKANLRDFVTMVLKYNWPKEVK